MSIEYRGKSTEQRAKSEERLVIFLLPKSVEIKFTGISSSWADIFKIAHISTKEVNRFSTIVSIWVENYNVKILAQ